MNCWFSRQRHAMSTAYRTSFVSKGFARRSCPPMLSTCKSRRFREFSGCRGEIEPAAMEVDSVDEVLFVAETASGILHPLNLGVDGLAGRVGATQRWVQQARRRRFASSSPVAAPAWFWSWRRRDEGPPARLLGSDPSRSKRAGRVLLRHQVGKGLFARCRRGPHRLHRAPQGLSPRMHSTP